MSIIDRMKSKYALHLLKMMNNYIDDADLDFNETRLIQRFIAEYLLKDCREDDCE